MDVQINEIQSQVRMTDSQALLDPRVLREIVRACVEAVKADQAREKKLAADLRLTPGLSSDEEQS